MNFDGEDDTHLPGETQLSYTLRKEGKLLQAKTRRNQNATLHKLEVEHCTNETCSSFQLQQLEGALIPIIDHSGSCPILSPRNLNQSSNSVALHGPSTDEYLSPWSPGSNFTLPVTPHAHSPQSFLYPDHGDVLRDSRKPEAFLPHDSKHRQKAHSNILFTVSLKATHSESQLFHTSVICLCRWIKILQKYWYAPHLPRASRRAWEQNMVLHRSWLLCTGVSLPRTPSYWLSNSFWPPKPGGMPIWHISSLSLFHICHLWIMVSLSILTRVEEWCTDMGIVWIGVSSF